MRLHPAHLGLRKLQELGFCLDQERHRSGAEDAGTSFKGRQSLSLPRVED